MAEITASLVKELRERTGAGMMDCKKALTEANGDIELAIENMRKSGAIKAAKKAGNVAADGVIKTKIDGNYGIILEVNCQTDFVAKDAGFQAFADKVLDAAVAGKITDVEVLKAQFEEELAEKMVEGRMKKFTGEVSLTGQPFVMEPSKTVGQLLKEHNAEVTGFIRFEVGEGIEKVETDFAAEVAAMSKQS